MTTQITIDDILAETSHTQSRSKRLVKNTMETTTHEVLNFLKKNALTKDNRISGQKIADYFGFDNTATVRKHIRAIRNAPENDLIVASDSQGYWLPSEEEERQGIELMLYKTLSQIETIINMYPRSAMMIHTLAGWAYKKKDKAVQNQTSMKFNGWENGIMNKFADKYITKKENK
jgi:biotin operon repressor